MDITSVYTQVILETGHLNCYDITLFLIYFIICLVLVSGNVNVTNNKTDTTITQIFQCVFSKIYKLYLVLFLK